jgi:hypothetical protein
VNDPVARNSAAQDSELTTFELWIEVKEAGQHAAFRKDDELRDQVI